MTDTETIRKALVERINQEAAPREHLEARYGQVWSTSELQQAFDILRFAAPLVIVRCRASGQKGSLYFQHHPRFYFSFEADR